MATTSTLNGSRFGLGLHGLPQAAPPPPIGRAPNRCTVLAGDLEHRDALELVLGAEQLLAVAPGQDAIAAISAVLWETPTAELHLVAHGAPGQIQLGQGIDRADLLDRAEEIGGWGVARIVLWSCRVGADLNFVSALEELSGASVIASAEALGKGQTLEGSDFPELAAGVAAFPLELAITGTINFDNISGTNEGMPGQYGGLNWNGFAFLNSNNPGWEYYSRWASSPSTFIYGQGSFSAPDGQSFDLTATTMVH